MTRLDRYVFLSWAQVFALALGAVLGVLVLAEVQNDLPDLLEAGASASESLRYFIILIPSFLPSVLPLALLVSLLFTLGQLQHHEEITAMRAAGLGLGRISRTLWLAGFALAGLLFWLNAEVVPRSVEEAREIKNRYQFAQQLAAGRAAEEIGLHHNLTFFAHRDGRLWFLNRFNDFTYRAYGVTVSLLAEDGRETTRLAAAEGFFDERQGHWTLLNGRETSFNAAGQPVRSLPFEHQEFTELREDPELMKFLEKKPQDLSLLQLRQVITALRADEDPRVSAYNVQYFQNLFTPASCLVVVGLAVPFALRGGRTNPLVGVSQVMGWFLVYYCLIVGFDLAGSAQQLPPALAAALPNLIIGTLAGWLLLRAGRPTQ